MRRSRTPWPRCPRTQLALLCSLAAAGCVAKGLDAGWDAALEMERTELTRLRNTEQAKKAIQAFFEKSSKPKPAPAAAGG